MYTTLLWNKDHATIREAARKVLIHFGEPIEQDTLDKVVGLLQPYTELILWRRNGNHRIMPRPINLGKPTRARMVGRTPGRKSWGGVV